VKPWILLALVACACKREPPARTADGTIDGAAVYARMCVTCHGSTGQPPPVMVARLGVRDLTSQELRSRITPGLVETQVREGSQNKLMPAFAGALSAEEIRAVAAYVSSPGFLDRHAARSPRI
jgi:quinoprotein glucose dehydrogenase